MPDNKTVSIEDLSTGEIIRIMNDEDMRVVEMVRDALNSIIEACEETVKTMRSGGSLIYVGAGTSGRLGGLDAAEMPPTFNTPKDMFRAIIAGGKEAMVEAAEGAEDDENAGKDSVRDISSKDMLLGIAASGKTPFTIAALKEGKRLGARCWLLTCSDVKYDFLDGIIFIKTGSEIVSGSTRLKAATATKMALNMISTAAMIRLGRVYRGYMIDVSPSNEKLRKRALEIVKGITGCDKSRTEELLFKAGGNAKTAILMHFGNMDYQDAVAILEKSGGSLPEAMRTIGNAG